MQDLIKNMSGVVCFRANSIVRRLLDENRSRGFGLNELSGMKFSQSDWEQFYQLVGYSLSGYHELPQVSDSSCLEASRLAREVVPGARGCRDGGCLLHCGVKSEKTPTRKPRRKARS